MTNNEKALVELYQEAQLAIYKTITEKAARGSPAYYERAVLKEVNAEIAKLNAGVADWAPQAIPDEYQKGLKAAEKNIAAQGGANYTMTQAQMVRINNAAARAITFDTIAKLQGGNAAMQRSIKKAVSQKLITGETVQDLKGRIIEQIYGSQGDGKMIINGRKYDPTKYAETVARTSTREAFNTASVKATEAVGSDLVKMSTHSPTCGICGPLQGRVFSISGASDIYPPLDAAWGTAGYATVHPNCRHVFNPYIEDVKTEEQLKQDRKWSSRPIDMDGRSKRSIEIYDRQQRVQANNWRDKSQYERYKARLGPDKVPKTWSGFKRMKHAKNQDNWNELHSEYKAAVPKKPSA